MVKGAGAEGLREILSSGRRHSYVTINSLVMNTDIGR